MFARSWRLCRLIWIILHQGVRYEEQNGKSTGDESGAKNTPGEIPRFCA